MLYCYNLVMRLYNPVYLYTPEYIYDLRPQNDKQKKSRLIIY